MVARAKTIVPASSVVRRRMLGLTAASVPAVPACIAMAGSVPTIALGSNAASLQRWMSYAVPVPKGIPGGVTKGRVKTIAKDLNVVCRHYWVSVVARVMKGIGAMLEPAKTIVVRRNVAMGHTTYRVAPAPSGNPGGVMPVPVRTTAPVASAEIHLS